jgi:hypothetical protein
MKKDKPKTVEQPTKVKASFADLMKAIVKPKKNENN